MRCNNCGKESGGKYCIYCGEKLSDEDVKILTQTYKKDGLESKEKDNDEVKLPLVYRMWFIIVVAFLTGCLFSIPAIIMLIVRIKKYPDRKKPAVICLLVLGILAIISILSIVAGYISSTANEKAIEEYLKNGDYESAIEYVDKNYDATGYSYYSKKADIYVASDDYDSAAQSIMDYCNNQPNYTKLATDAESRLLKYKDKVTDKKNEEISELLEKIKTEKAEKEKEEKEKEELKTEAEKAKVEAAKAKAEAEKAKKEAEESKAKAEKADEEAKKIREESKTQAKKSKEENNKLQTDKKEAKDTTQNAKESNSNKADEFRNGQEDDVVGNSNRIIKDLSEVKRGQGYRSEDGLMAISVTEIPMCWKVTIYSFDDRGNLEDKSSDDGYKRSDGTYYTKDGVNFYFDGENIIIINDDGSETRCVYDPDFPIY